MVLEVRLFIRVIKGFLFLFFLYMDKNFTITSGTHSVKILSQISYKLCGQLITTMHSLHVN